MIDAGQNIEQLFQTYYARLCYYAIRFTGNKEVAEDIVQEVFLNFWKKKLRFNNESQAKTYLYTSIKNACLNISRHQQVVSKFNSNQNDATIEDAKALENMIRSEVLGEIHAAIEKLPEGCRQVLKLAFFESLKNEEIASHLGISVNTVKTQKARALQLLRFKLDAGSWILLYLILHT
ncbi:MAG TPA: RNA polymerase sigma-70 factor [Chitinophagaceae bacterium]|nr:RNA polymerase sigma-70 factor [Chitinophagaceae bacterium]